MIKLGRINKLKITEVKKDSYLFSEDRHIFSVSKYQLPGSRNIGDEIEGFIYSDKDGNFYFTPQKPYAILGEFAYFKILEVTASGSFADWGIGTDLFVPSKETDLPIKKDAFYTLFIKMDKRFKQIIGTTKIREYLVDADQYIKRDDKVKFLVISLHSLGYRVIINNRYLGLVFADGVIGKLNLGEKRTGIISNISDEGRIDVSLFRGQAGLQKHAEQIILDLLQNANGFLPLHDKTLPKVIESKTGMSKKLFKKVIGSLYRMRRIELKENGIQLTQK